MQSLEDNWGALELKKKNKRVPAAYQEPSGTPAREFIRIWQSASSVAEVAKQVNRTKNAVRVRAFRYREMGIPLKEFPAVEAELIDWDELAEFASTCHLSETAH
jgi:hypothetical protein